MGVAVFSGMLGVTLFGLLLTPVFYVLLRTLATRFERPASAPLPPGEAGVRAAALAHLGAPIPHPARSPQGRGKTTP